jgi:hypothetical protein
VENVLLNEYMALHKGVERNGYDTLDTDHQDVIQQFEARDRFTKLYSWAVPNQKAIEALVKHSPVVEIGAGTGYWAALVKAAGGDIVAFDKHPPRLNSEENHYHPHTKLFYRVREGTEEIAAEYPDRALFLCWPPYDTSMAWGALHCYTGKTVIFVGEGSGGCTGNDEFFEILHRDFDQTDEITIPCIPYHCDYMGVYQRK